MIVMIKKTYDSAILTVREHDRESEVIFRFGAGDVKLKIFDGYELCKDCGFPFASRHCHKDGELCWCDELGCGSENCEGDCEVLHFERAMIRGGIRRYYGARWFCEVPHRDDTTKLDKPWHKRYALRGREACSCEAVR